MMQDLAQGVRQQIIKETAPKVVSPGAFTMRSLWRTALWGGTAAAALMIAVWSGGRGDFDPTRLSEAIHGDLGPSPRPLDAQAETQRLAQALHELSLDNVQLKARLASVEQDMSDVTGSIGKQLEAAGTADASQRTDAGPSVIATAGVSAGMPAPSAMTAFPPGPAPSAHAIAQAGQPARIAYGVDIGSGFTIQALRARWTAVRSARPEIFAGLEPILSVRDAPRANRVELRLVAGPFPDAGAAARLCAELTPSGLSCQPAMYDGQHLAEP